MYEMPASPAWITVPTLYGNTCASINIYANDIFYVTIESDYYYGCTMSFRAKDIVYPQPGEPMNLQDLKALLKWAGQASTDEEFWTRRWYAAASYPQPTTLKLCRLTATFGVVPEGEWPRPKL